MKGRLDPSNFEPVREVRSLADIVFLRMLIVKINLSSTYTSIPESISRHLKFFSQKSITHYFFEYENILWKENFLQNLLEVAHINDHIEFIPKNYFCQLVNGAIDFAYRLSTTHRTLQTLLNREEIKGRLIPTQEEVYVGSRNYTPGLEVTDVDIVWT